jgi:hypothetical protein
MINVDRAKFFVLYRDKLDGVLTQSEVDGLNSLLDNFEKEERVSMLEHYAYILATVLHETAKTMQPIKEYGLGKGRAYGTPQGHYRKVYYGRGYVQLTWLKNYQTMAQITGEPLVARPDLALEPNIAYTIMIEGMNRGLFTGISLNRCISPESIDYVKARRIINGTDKAQLIAGIAKTFENILRESQTE